jgi:hypothetical protein
MVIETSDMRRSFNVGIGEMSPEALDAVKKHFAVVQSNNETGA